MTLQTMTRSKKLDPVKNIAQTREDHAVKALGDSQKTLTEHQKRLHELREYQRQYVKSFESTSGSGLAANRVSDFRVFLSRLGDAIRQQEQLISQCQNQHEQTRDDWIDKRNHTQALDKLVKRYQRQETQDKDRREQQESDEHSQRRRTKPPDG